MPVLVSGNKPGQISLARSSSGQLVWVKLGNCRRPTLIAAFEQSLPAVLAALESQQRVVVLA
jgi:predicted nuclease of predicted toxin-antitoxin system